MKENTNVAYIADRKSRLLSLFSNLPILPTTVVGSYPVTSATDRSKSALSRLRYLADPLKASLHTAVKEQIDAGISIISDGQVRGDMIGVFASKLPGIQGKNIIGKIRPTEKYITINDTKYARSKFQFVKGIITGPTTLTYGLHLKAPLYRNKDEVVSDITTALLHEVQGLYLSDVSILQVDEPVFSTGIANLEEGKIAIKRIRDETPLPLCLHVCGPVHTIIDDYIAMPVDILDLEGTQAAENISVLSHAELKGRYIGYGCVDTSRPVLETVEEIVSRVSKAMEYLPPQQLILDPDCGMRMLPHEIAREKLSRLCTAADTIRKEI